MMRDMARRMVVFDLDGTLLRSGSATGLIGGRFGAPPALRAVQERYRTGRCSNAAVAAATAPMFTGRHIDEVTRTLLAGNWIAGIDDVVAELRDAGALVVLATVGWDFVAEIVARRHGFQAWCGTEMGRDGGRLSGRVVRPLEGHDKAEFVRCLCWEHHVALDDVAAIGDSRSDLALFELVGHAIALNADAEVRAVASRAIDTDDLRDLLPWLRGGVAPRCDRHLLTAQGGPITQSRSGC